MAATAIDPVTLPAPWHPVHVGAGVWFAARRDVAGVREHCPGGERQARALAADLNRAEARSAVAAQEAVVAAAAVQWLERREDGEWYTAPDDRLAPEARRLRTLQELYRDRYPNPGPL